MIVLVDLDGPVADFDGAFFAICESMGWAMDIASPMEQRHRFATDHIPDKEDRRSARSYVNESRWFLDLPIVDGAAEGLRELDARDGVDVWLCTKPLEANKTCRDDKAQWVIDKLGPEWERKLIVTPDKSMVRGDILVDDAPYMEWLARSHWHPIIFPMPWNGEGSKWAGLPRWSWEDPIKDLLAPTARAD